MKVAMDLDTYTSEVGLNLQRTGNFSKSEIQSAIKMDITGQARSTDFMLDQGKSLSELADQESAVDVQTKQDMMTVASNTMSEEDYKKMCEEGFDPSDMSAKESVTILDHIKVEMAKSGEITEGFNDDMSAGELEAITGNRADAGKLANAMKQADLPVNKENGRKINQAAGELSQIDELNENAIKYMVENKLEPTIENIYTAKYSSVSDAGRLNGGYYSVGMQGYLAKRADLKDTDKLDSQIDKALDDMDIEDIERDQLRTEAKWLINNGLELNEQNILRLDEISNLEFPVSYEEALKIAANSVAEGKTAKSANLIKNSESIYEKATDILEKTKAVKDSDLSKVGEDQTLNLKNIWESMEGEEVSLTEDATTVAARRNLEEIRLRMTLEVNVGMLKRGVEIDTLPLSNLVDELKKQEQSLRADLFGEGSEEVLSQKESLYKETRQTINEIPTLPAAAIGRLYEDEDYSLRDLRQTGEALKKSYEAAQSSYETLMTSPRADMGDSIQKAFRNVDDILSDLGLEVNDENRKAVRILGYNNMTINEDQISAIRDACEQVEKVVNEMTPARTLELIRQGVNPMEMSMEELDNTLNELKEGEDSAQKYAQFLYKLEQSEDITESEREAYIGIYRMVNRLEKTDFASVGSLVKGNNEMTFGNLLSGIRSRKAKFNVKIDDDFGMLTDVVKRGASITDQIEQAFVAKVGDDNYKELMDRYNAEQAKELRKNIEMYAGEAEELDENKVEVTVNNLVSAALLKDPKENVFNKVKNYNDEIKEAQQGLLNKSGDEDADVDGMEVFMEAFDNKENAGRAYEQMLSSMKETIADMSEYIASTSIDLKALSLCNKQLSLAMNYAKSESYILPFENENGDISTINLTLRHDASDRGRITASMESEEYGYMSLDLKVDGDSVKGLMATDSRKGLERLKEVCDKMSQELGKECDIKAVLGKQNLKSNSAEGNQLPENADNNNVDTRELYRVAKTFINAFR